MKDSVSLVTRKFGPVLIYGVLFTFFCTGVYFLLVRAFTIREIRVMGGDIQVSVDEKRLPRTLLFFPSDKMRAQLLASNPILADIRFDKYYPHTLVIVPTLRTPSILLITPSRRVFIDAQGIVLADADTAPRGLTQITSPISGLRIGQKVNDKGLSTGIAFVLQMQALLPIETMTISDDRTIQAHTQNLDIIFTQESDISSILGTLQTLIAGFRIKGTLPKVIDLRFDKPVVTF